jgi:hypothetical protein
VRGAMRECRCVNDVDDVALAGVAGPAASFTRETEATARYCLRGLLKYSSQTCRDLELAQSCIWRGSGESGAYLSNVVSTPDSSSDASVLDFIWLVLQHQKIRRQSDRH